MIKLIDIAWLAGLLEGEGSFIHIHKKGPKSTIIVGHLQVIICMTDKDVIERVDSILGFGSFRKPRLLPSGKIAYGWSVTNQYQAAGLMMTLLPFMGERRSAQIRQCLEAWKAKSLRYGLIKHCKHGHPLSGDNLLIIIEGKYTKRRCRACGYNRSMKHRGSLLRR